MRVISGSARGHALRGPPPGAATRPTTDGVREALFSALGDVSGLRVLDLFAGTGALGIEALSRGAAHAVFVESERALVTVIRANLDATRLADRATVISRDVRRAGPQLAAHGPFDVVLLDPPYGHALEHDALAMLTAQPLLADDATVVVEHAGRDPFAPRGDTLAVVRTRRYGDAALTWLQPKPHTPEREDPVTRTAVYPGSFDPLTNGHWDVIRRALTLFDRLVIAVASNVRKQSLFTTDERIEMIRATVGDDPRVEIDTFSGLLVEYAKRRGAVAVVRGLRAVADFEYEFQMASMNRRLGESVETVFLMTHENYFYVSSHLVKEVAMLGGNVDDFVPPPVRDRLRARLASLPPR